MFALIFRSMINDSPLLKSRLAQGNLSRSCLPSFTLLTLFNRSGPLCSGQKRCTFAYLFLAYLTQYL